MNGRPLAPDRPYSVTMNEAVLVFLPLLGIPAADPQVLPIVGWEAARDLVRDRHLLWPVPEGRIIYVGLVATRR